MRRLPLWLILVAGCARHVVLDPGEVERLDERAWTVLREPGQADASAPPAPPAP